MGVSISQCTLCVPDHLRLQTDRRLFVGGLECTAACGDEGTAGRRAYTHARISHQEACCGCISGCSGMSLTAIRLQTLPMQSFRIMLLPSARAARAQFAEAERMATQQIAEMQQAGTTIRTMMSQKLSEVDELLASHRSEVESVSKLISQEVEARVSECVPELVVQQMKSQEWLVPLAKEVNKEVPPLVRKYMEERLPTLLPECLTAAMKAEVGRFVEEQVWTRVPLHRTHTASPPGLK
jgi:hypothetical protein